MATQAQKDAAAKRRKEAEAKKNAAQKILQTGKNADGTTASAAQRAAAIKRRDGHIKTMKSAEATMESATTEAITATHDLARIGRQEAKAEQEYAKLVFGAGSPQHLAAIKKVEEAAKYIKAQVLAADLSHDDAKAKREALVKQTVGKSGQELIDLQTQIRAYGDRMRLLTGRQKGEGTSYIGPGLRVALDADGKIKRDSQGRVMYDVDTDAYTSRFIAPFKPTAEQIKMGEELFPGVGITEGYLTPWQQVNIQWMTGSKNEKGEILDDLGITPTDKNIGLFEDDLKEGRIPKSWRDAWRAEKWGDVKDTDPNSPTYGLWTPATGEKRQAAIAEQRKRYEAGYFNPTTGKGGDAKGAPADWGPNTGTISPDDYVPGPDGPVRAGDVVDDNGGDDNGGDDNTIWGGGKLTGDYGETVTKGLFGFSGENPADFAKPRFNYLNAYNIGQNLAYKPWHSASWRAGETKAERDALIAEGKKPTYYGGIPGGTKTRDQLYTYGGTTPMQVPGEWTPAALPAGSKSAYPIARTPLYPSGRTSAAGPLPAYVPVEGDDDGGKKKKPADGGTTTAAGAGTRLNRYTGRAGAFGGGNLMFQVTGEPVKKYIGDGKTSWGNMGVDLWQDGTLFQTTAHRAMTGKDWTDANNQWVLRQTAEMKEANINKPNIQFATWAGKVPTVGPYGMTPTLDFLGTPQNQMVTDPTSNRQTRVAYTLPTSYGKSYSTGGSETLAPYISGTTPAQNWAQLAGMKTKGFDAATGGKWVLPGIYGHSIEAGDIRTPTTNLLGYGLPQFLTDAMLDETGGDTSGINWGSMPSNSKEMM